MIPEVTQSLKTMVICKKTMVLELAQQKDFSPKAWIMTWTRPSTKLCQLETLETTEISWELPLTNLLINVITQVIWDILTP